MRFGAREYIPELGRWAQKDPSLFIDGFNLYVYANNSPANWTDPTGLQAGVPNRAGHNMTSILGI